MLLAILVSKLSIEKCSVLQVDLCGHATLAAASTLFKSGLVNTDIIEFSTLSGILTAKKVPDGVEVASGSTIPNGEAQDSYFIELNFPADPSNEFNSTDASLISNALGGASVIDIRRTTVTDDLLVSPAIFFKTLEGIRFIPSISQVLLRGRNSFIYLAFGLYEVYHVLLNVTCYIFQVLLPSGKAVLDLLPQYDEIKKCPGTRGVIVTAVAPPESGYDFYSRFFCPTNGIGEV